MDEVGFFEVDWLGDFVAVIDNGDYGDTYVQTCWKAYIWQSAKHAVFAHSASPN